MVRIILTVIFGCVVAYLGLITRYIFKGALQMFMILIIVITVILPGLQNIFEQPCIKIVRQ